MSPAWERLGAHGGDGGGGGGGGGVRMKGWRARGGRGGGRKGGVRAVAERRALPIWSHTVSPSAPSSHDHPPGGTRVALGSPWIPLDLLFGQGGVSGLSCCRLTLPGSPWFVPVPLGSSYKGCCLALVLLGYFWRLWVLPGASWLFPVSSGSSGGSLCLTGPPGSSRFLTVCHGPHFC